MLTDEEAAAFEAWPEDGCRSAYYAPSRIETSEPPAPPPQPRLIKRVAPSAADGSNRVVQVTDYSWVDEGLFVKVFVPVPGVTRESVSTSFEDTHIEMTVSGLPTGTYTLSLRRLFDRIYPPDSFAKARPPRSLARPPVAACPATHAHPSARPSLLPQVQPSKGRVVLVLAKPPRAHTYSDVKIWPRLSLGTQTDDLPFDEFPHRKEMPAEDLPALPKPARRDEWEARARTTPEGVAQVP